MGPVLTLEDVGFRFGSRWALRGVDLQVRAGEVLGILGPNGSGKTTLLKIMDGMLAPQEGKVRIGERPLGRLKRSEIARRVAMVAQESHFRFAFSALEVVLMGRFSHLKAFQFEGPADMDKAVAALRATDALHCAERPIHELSGGEKQRVLIARALAQEADIILLDEPTSFLDLKYKREIFRLVSELGAGKGLSVVLVSHDIDLAAQYCHRLILLSGGSVYCCGRPEEVVTAEHIRSVYDCPVIVDRNPATGRPRVNLKE